jgi:hypothetical protein
MSSSGLYWADDDDDDVFWSGNLVPPVEEPDSPAVSALAEAKQRSQWSVMGWVTKTLSEGTLSRWSRLHLQSLAPTNRHWDRVVGYGPFSLWLIHKEGLCPTSGDINRPMMMMNLVPATVHTRR